MSTTFKVFYLGSEVSIDPTEGNALSENAGALVGNTYGTTSSPLYDNIQTFSPGSTGYSDGASDAYDTDNDTSFFEDEDTFRINGGSDQTFDAIVVYGSTITYTDGTTASITAVVFQDTDGKLYLAPEYATNSDQDALELKAIRSITFDTLSADDTNMTASRYDGSYVTPDDTVDGSAGDDSIGAGYIDAQGDEVDGGDGDNDSIVAGAGNDTIDGGAGADTIYYGSGNDLVYGGDGSDWIDDASGIDSTVDSSTVFGGTGSDTIFGTAGNDSLDGGADNDLIRGESGSDTISGGSGSDTLYGDSGNDSIEGDGNHDLIFGGDGDDTLDGGAGNDTIYGEGGDDLIYEGSNSNNPGEIYGGDGNDTIYGGTGGGSDLLVGDSGDDLIVDLSSGSISFDTLQGGTGSDTLDAGFGDDLVHGGDDADVIVLKDDFGNDTITGGEGGTDSDTIDLTALTGSVTVTYSSDELGTITDGTFTADFSEIEKFLLTDYNDIVVANTATSVGIDVDAGAGQDTIEGSNGGNDTIVGGAGADSLRGWEGDDLIDGGSGDDLLQGDDGSDTLIGGTGDDYISLWTGNDSVLAGDGSDTITIHDSFGNDTIFGGEGGTDDDTLDLTWLTGPVTVSYSGDEAGTITDGTDTISFSEIENIFLTDGDDNLDGSFDDFGVNVFAEDGNDSISGGSASDTIDGGSGNDFLSGSTGDDSLTGGSGDDTFTYAVGDGDDTISDFNAGNSGSLNDGDSDNNDAIDLSGFYDTLFELHADQLDDGVLNQSNSTDTKGRSVDYSNNDQFGTGSLTFSGASGDSSSFTEENTGVICFASGTAIRTPTGDTLIDELKVGDLVTTLDNGPQKIKWISHRSYGLQDLLSHPHLLPVMVRKGTFGAERDLLVSQQHGILVGHHGDFLVRAKHLVSTSESIRIAKGKRRVTYIHLMFEQHQVILAENVATESFYPGPMSLRAMRPKVRHSFEREFPQIRGDRSELTHSYSPVARKFCRFIF